MLGTFLDKASGLLDRRFLVAWWFPALAGGAAALLLGLAPGGLDAAWRGWWALAAGVQTWALLAALLLVTLAAYLLQAFTRPLVRLYEGYWPERLARRGVKRIEARWRRWGRACTQAAASGDRARYAALQERLHYEYPARAERLLPTRLGNALRAAEDYPAAVYGMDVVFWWPRLAALLPEAARQGIEDALTPLLALLNLAALAGLVGVGGALHLGLSRAAGWFWPWAVLLGGLVLARLAYLGAVAQARGYGLRVRTAVDLYRFDLLKALRQPLPPTPQAERALWEQLAQWLYNQDRGAAQGLAYDHGKAGEKSGDE